MQTRTLLSLTALAAVTASSSFAQLPNNCVESLFARNNGGSIGGAVYFDLTVTQQVSISGLLTNTAETFAGGVNMWTTPGTSVGNETNAGAWIQVGTHDGTAIGLGINQMTPVTFLQPVILTPGTYGIALIADQWGHDYTNGTGANQNFVSGDGVLSLSLGTASNVPFTAGIFSPRVWNGRLCSGGGVPTVGTNYCGPAVANSTGNSGVISGTGSASVAANDLTLHASNLPTNAFGFFLTSLSQGLVPQPGGSVGVLCLGGSIGRYVGAGQIQNSGAMGEISLLLDLTQHPTPMGLVSVNAGETWNFQGWHRDTSGAGAVSNFTDGLEVLFN